VRLLPCGRNPDGWRTVTGVFERFSDLGRRVVAVAQQEAKRLDHGHVGTEHLLLGILAVGEGTAAAALVDAGVKLEGTRQKVAEAVGPDHGGARHDGELPLTDRARRSLERANRLSIRERDDEVDPEHILLSVIQVEGRAGQVLRGLGVDPGVIAREVESPGQGPGRDQTGGGATAASRGKRGAAARAGGAPSPAAVAASGNVVAPARAAAGVASPACGGCGAELEGALAHRGMASRGESGELRAFVIVYCSACGSALGSTNV
jgi:Clp amino terminal domain, pathogenicity island component